jgi:uncharacterized membrane protein YfcA
MIEVLIGFVGGILVGATGAGVGLLITPLLVLVGYRPALAIAIGLGLLVTSKVVGAITHHQMGNLPGRAVWILAAGGIGGAVLTWWAFHTWMAAGTVEADVLWKRLLGVALLVAACGLLFNTRNGESRHVLDGHNRPTVLLAVGAGAAAPVTLTSMGSGSLLVPVLVLVTDWTVPQLAAASNLFGGVVGGLGMAFHARLGLFDWVLFAKVAAGLLPGAGVGAFLSKRISRSWFAFGFGVLGLFLGVRLLFG